MRLSSSARSWGGVLVALNVVVANRRAKAMEDAAASQAEGMKRQAKANRLTEQGQRQERLKNALDRLGSESPVQQFAAAYELVHLAGDTEELRGAVLAIFCEHIRQTTRSDGYKEQHRAEPSTEIQSLLTLLLCASTLHFVDVELISRNVGSTALTSVERGFRGPICAECAWMERAWVTRVFMDRYWSTHTSRAPSSREHACESAISWRLKCRAPG